MSDEQVRAFLDRALTINKEWTEENAPVCSSCGEKTEYSETTFDYDHNEFLVFWTCPCGNVETQQWVRPLEEKVNG